MYLVLLRERNEFERMKNLWKRAVVLLLALAMVLSVSACGGNSSSGNSSGNSGQSAASTGDNELVIARPEDSDNLDPVTQDGNVNIWLFGLTMEGLVRTSDDGMSIEPCLAESWDVSEDGLQYTFHLKPDVKFANGDPVTTEDWIWSIERARDTASSAWSFSLAAISSVEAPDDSTLVITLTQPWAPILADLAMFNASVQSKAYYDEVGAEAYTQAPMGTGPFYFAEWQKGEYLLLQKNTNYWNPEEPKLDSIRFTVVPDDNSRVMQLQAGEVDAITFVPWNRMQELDDDEDIVAVGLPSTETRNLIMNNTIEPLNDVRVRQALAMATDRQELMDVALYGYGELATSFINPSVSYSASDKVSFPAYDPEGAKALLEEAGYGDGFELTLSLDSGNTVNATLGTLLKEQWAEVGVTLNLETLEKGTINERMNNMTLDLQLRSWTSDMADPSQAAEYACVNSNANCLFSGWQNTEAEQLVEQANMELDTTKRQEIYDQLQQLYVEEMPVMNLFYIPYPVAYRSNVENFIQTPLGAYRLQETTK